MSNFIRVCFIAMAVLVHSIPAMSKDTIQRPVCECCDLGRSDCCSPACGAVSAQQSFIAAEKAPPKALSCPIPRRAGNLSPTLVALRERYAVRDEMVACSQAAGVLVPLRDKIYAGQFGPPERAASEAYVAACLQPGVLLFGSDLTSGEKEAIEERAAFLVSESDALDCHGFRVGQHVLTALHCIRPSQGHWRVRMLKDPTIYEANEVPLGNRLIDPNVQPKSDYALLKLKGFPPTPAGEESRLLAKPAAGTRLILPQSNMYVRILRKLGIADDWRSSFTIQHNPVCYAREVTSEGYILHSCQTEWGTSGAPILQRDADGKVVLVGVHDGATGRLPDGYGKCEALVPNHGVALPLAEIIKAISDTR